MALNPGGRLKDFGDLVKFSHTIFLFPFALSALLLATREHPLTVGIFFWVVVALVAARSAAMIMNRIADRRYDALNPRTAMRPLVTGRVSPALAWAWLVLACALLVLAAAMLNPLCLRLSPVALAWVLGYSFTKRFTWLCHLWLGLATALAPLGAWIAVTGAWDWRAAVLAGAAALWVVGFDVIYACQDIEFDTSQCLHSLPARLGLERALWVSRGMHALTILGFFALAPLFNLGDIYLLGSGVVALALVVEQALVAVKRANIPMAFFTVNGFVSIAFLVFLILDLWLGGAA
ncbi:4-hydroxybenzoate octaprenyltransferase [Desulfoferula mesophila]|uniref:4-hydroxybenzoate octaprenyltransferase n=1 Tax=Desulfoferula mesophila TaxID=3058419 RepID=A0AAU9EEV0_9BACT|nr:4-hydroxybenzoate octaprenyltransferase [Desulfoferula mesophilus]